MAGGEIIRFEVGNKSFVWNFNGQRSSFDLARVAPTSVLDHKVTAYVASNPMYPSVDEALRSALLGVACIRPHALAFSPHTQSMGGLHK